MRGDGEINQRLEARELRKAFGKKLVIRNLSLYVTLGEVVGLLGPNGAGKTTTFNMLMGNLRPDGGRIYLNGKDITNLPMYMRARLGMGYLPQEPSIFRKMTVYDNIYSILEFRGFSKKECREKTDYVLNLMGIEHLSRSMAYNLSGGERRRVEIARALVLNPSYLLLDEPFTGIDPKTREEIQDILRKLAQLNIGIIITDHNVRETLEVTDRAYIIYDGEVLIEGTSKDLVSSEEARKIYLGERFRL